MVYWGVQTAFLHVCVLSVATRRRHKSDAYAVKGHQLVLTINYCSLHPRKRSASAIPSKHGCFFFCFGFFLKKKFGVWAGNVEGLLTANQQASCELRITLANTRAENAGRGVGCIMWPSSQISGDFFCGSSVRAGILWWV